MASLLYPTTSRPCHASSPKHQEFHHLTQEAEIRSITVRSQPQQIVYETISKIFNTKKDWQSGTNGRMKP
jgi:hypothetical protein